MALLFVSVNGETVDVTSGPVVGTFVKDYEDRIPHTNALTIKADGILLTPRSHVPKDALTLELVEMHDADVVSDTPGDVIINPSEVPASATETMPQTGMPKSSSKRDEG